MAVIDINLTLSTTDVPEGTNLYFTETRVRATVLTGLNITGSSISASDSILSAFGKVQNQINGVLGGAIYQGTWNATTNTPTLASGVGTKGYYYVVSVAGSTNLDGVTDWKVGDWAIYNGTAWEKVDNTDAVSSVNGYIGAVNLVTSDIPEDGDLYFTDARAVTAIINGWVDTSTIESGVGLSLNARLQMSLDSDINGIKLFNDEETPGNNKYYGTDGAGGKGWLSTTIYTGTANKIDVDENGVITISPSYIGQTSITTLGTITTGTWSGSVIAADKGGTGQTVYAVGDILYANTTTSLSKLAAVAVGSMIISNGINTAPSWSTEGRLTSLSLNTAPYTTVSPLMIAGNANLREGGWNSCLEVQCNSTNAFPAVIFGNQTGVTRFSALIWTRSTTGNTTTGKQVQIQAYEGGNVGTFDINVNNNVGTSSPITMFKILGTVGVYIGGAVQPTAVLHLRAGTSTANTAPLQFTSGTVETVARAGVMEYNNTFHLTNSDGTRRHITTAPNTTKVTAGAPYANDGYVVINIGGTDFKVMTTA